MDLGRKIAGARIEAGYGTAEAFAEALGVSVWTVRGWERRKKPTRPDNVNMDRIVEVTGRPRSYFYGDDAGPAERLAGLVEQAQKELAAMRANNHPPPPDHPGVRELAADAELCRNHHVTPTELQELANLVAYRQGQQVILQTAAEALAVLQSLRMLGPVAENE
jgi:transcriptional regulator with XRE-family HTH domain